QDHPDVDRRPRTLVSVGRIRARGTPASTRHPLPNPPHKGEGVPRSPWHDRARLTGRHLPPCGGGWEVAGDFRILENCGALSPMLQLPPEGHPPPCGEGWGGGRCAPIGREHCGSTHRLPSGACGDCCTSSAPMDTTSASRCRSVP